MTGRSALLAPAAAGLAGLALLTGCTASPPRPDVQVTVTGSPSATVSPTPSPSASSTPSASPEGPVGLRDGLSSPTGTRLAGPAGEVTAGDGGWYQVLLLEPGRDPRAAVADLRAQLVSAGYRVEDLSDVALTAERADPPVAGAPASTPGGAPVGTPSAPPAPGGPAPAVPGRRVEVVVTAAQSAVPASVWVISTRTR